MFPVKPPGPPRLYGEKMTMIKDPINVVVSNYPTLAIYFDAEAETKEIRRRLAAGVSAGATAQEREATERNLDALAWKIRWTTQRAAKSETLMGLYNFPTNNLMLTGALDSGDYIFPVPELVLRKLEALYQEYLRNPELLVHVEINSPTGETLRPDFDLTIEAKRNELLDLAIEELVTLLAGYPAEFYGEAQDFKEALSAILAAASDPKAQVAKKRKLINEAKALFAQYPADFYGEAQDLKEGVRTILCV